MGAGKPVAEVPPQFARGSGARSPNEPHAIRKQYVRHHLALLRLRLVHQYQQLRNAKREVRLRQRLAILRLNDKQVSYRSASGPAMALVLQ